MSHSPADTPGQGVTSDEGGPAAQQEVLEAILAELAVALTGADVPPRVRALAEELQSALEAREKARQKG